MRKYNHIYKEIVKTDKDFIGIIGYSIYKKHKIDYIKKFEVDNNRLPTENELDSFHKVCNNEQSILNYRVRAETITQIFTEELLKEKLDEIEKFHKQKRDKGFFYGAWQSMVGSIFFSLLIGIIIFFLWSINFGPEDVLDNIMKKENASDRIEQVENNLTKKKEGE